MPAPRRSANLDHFVGRLQRAGAHEHGDLLTRVEGDGGTAEVGIERHHARRAVAQAGMNRAMGARRLFNRRHLLEIVRHNDTGDRAFGDGDTHGAVDDVPYLRRFGRHLDIVAGDVLE